MADQTGYCLFQCCADLKEAVLRETEGNGAGHLIEATGAPVLVNGCFALLRYCAVSCFGSN